jgi:hypothetical protein
MLGVHTSPCRDRTAHAQRDPPLHSRPVPRSKFLSPSLADPQTVRVGPLAGLRSFAIPFGLAGRGSRGQPATALGGACALYSTKPAHNTTAILARLECSEECCVAAGSTRLSSRRLERVCAE